MLLKSSEIMAQRERLSDWTCCFVFKEFESLVLFLHTKADTLRLSLVSNMFLPSVLSLPPPNRESGESLLERYVSPQHFLKQGNIAFGFFKIKCFTAGVKTKLTFALVCVVGV